MTVEVFHRAHDFLALRVAQPAYRLSLRTRAAAGTVARLFAQGLRFRESAVGWDDDRKRAWMLDRLRAAVRHAGATTPYYRELFASQGFDPRADFDFADFARLPVLERETVREAGERMLSSAVPAALLRRDATGGSTGTPTTIWRGPMEAGWGPAGTEFFMRRIGLPTGSRIGLLWGHHLDPVARSSLRDRTHDWINNVRWYDCLRLSEERLLGYHRELQAWRPRGMICYAGALAALADTVATTGDCPTYPTRAFVTGAEKLFAHQRAKVREVFGRPVHERYGARDTGLLGFQVDPERSLDYEIDWANVLIEPETEGEVASILVTKLHGDGMPMLRYRVGDLGRFPAGACPGEPSLSLHEVVGREVSRLWLPDGRWMNGLAFPHMLKDFPVRDFQVRQASDFSVRVLVVPVDGFDASARDAVVRVVEANLPGVPVSLEVVESIARTKSNKWNPVVSEARGGVPAGGQA